MTQIARRPPVSEAEARRWVNRLRFPRELEAAFAEEYYLRHRTPLRVMSVLFTLFWLGVAFLELRQEASLSHVAPTYGPVLATLLGMLALTFTRRFGSYWQPCLVLVNWLLTLHLLRTILGYILHDPKLPTPEAQLAAFLQVLVVIMVFLATLRLQFAWAALLQLSTLGNAVWLASVEIRMPAANLTFWLARDAVSVLVALVVTALVEERLYRSSFLNQHLLQVERARSESLLVNMMPAVIAARLMDTTEPIADDHPEVTVLFADVVGFTPFAAGRPAREVVGFLNEIFSRFDRLVDQHGMEKIKTVGDCYMVVAGAPVPREDHLEAMARFALALQAEAERMSAERGIPVRFRMGIQTGPLVAGVIGEKRFLYDVWGDTVNTASRLETYGEQGRIQVSAEVAERLRGRFSLTYRGSVEIKGKGKMETFFLDGEASPPAPSS